MKSPIEASVLKNLNSDGLLIFDKLFESAKSLYATDFVKMNQYLAIQQERYPDLKVFNSFDLKTRLPMSHNLEILLASMAIDFLYSKWDQFMAYGKDSNDGFCKQIEREEYSDFVTMSLDDAEYFGKFWLGGKQEITKLPYDLILTETLPLRNLIIKISDFSDMAKNDKRKECYFEISIHESASSTIQKLINEGERRDPSVSDVIGSISLAYPNINSYMSKVIIFDPFTQSVRIPQQTIFNNYSIARKMCFETPLTTNVCSEMFLTWYGIQLLLLNPVTRIVYNQKKNEVSKPNQKVKYGKRLCKCRYVKRIVLNKQDIEEHIKRVYTHRCQLWYVIGHWRTYKAGTPEEYKVFVKGFWKGAAAKTASDEVKRIMRERVVK